MPQLPTGTNSPNNPYYARRNHVKLAKEQETPTQFLADTDGEAAAAMIMNDGAVLHDANQNQFIPSQG